MPTTLEVKLPPGRAATDLEPVLAALSTLQASALELFDDEDPATVLALFPDDQTEGLRERVVGALEAAGVQGANVGARPARVADHGAAWLDAARPFRIGPLWIAPGGRAPAGASPCVRLQAGGAFGSGLHETTALCLERIVELSPIARTLDVGTGTGILAIAALLLGGAHATAIDTDPRALAAAAANAQASGVAGRLTLGPVERATPGPGAPPTGDAGQFQLILANIVAAELAALAPDLVRLLGSGGLILLSGVREDEAEEVARCYRDLGLRRLADEVRNGWVRLELAASW